jgi:serine/threonine-protein kinase
MSRRLRTASEAKIDSKRWEIIQTLFHGAAELPESERPAFLKTACGGDKSLVAEVLALLEEDARNRCVLDQDLAHVAQEVLGEHTAPALAFQQIGPYRISKYSARAAWAWSTSRSAETCAASSPSRSCATPGSPWGRRERFSSEQRTLAQLNHPGIARLYDAGTLDDGTPWFAMEYVDGIPLADYCSRRRCSILERLLLFRAVCEAVHYAHQQAVIHRDLKDSNILVKPDGSPRLLDFGIAKQMESLDTAADQTRTGLRLMTPAYAAPEQIRGERVGVQADVYALGIILYRLLAGRLPFDLTTRTPAEAGPSSPGRYRRNLLWSRARRPRRRARIRAIPSAGRPGLISMSCASPPCTRTRDGDTSPLKRWCATSSTT